MSLVNNDPLDAAIRSLQTSNFRLRNMLESLDSHQADSLRMKKVLISDRQFEMVPEREIIAAQSEYDSETERAVRGYLSKAEQDLLELQKTYNQRQRDQMLKEQDESLRRQYDEAKLRNVELEAKKILLKKEIEELERRVNKKP